MTSPASSPSFPAPYVDPVVVPRLREALVAAGYTVDGITELLGPGAEAALLRGQLAPVRSRLVAHPGAAATLLWLWGLLEPVSRAELDAALPGVATDGLLACRLIVAADDEAGASGSSGRSQTGSTDGEPDALYRATCDVRPYAVAGGGVQLDAYVVSDLTPIGEPEPLPADHVLGVGAASMTLAAWMPRLPSARRVLDLGTGCGVQALSLAAVAEGPVQVVATDTEERALEFAAFTAALSGMTGERAWELRRGSFFEPVEGELFDLIVSNPPFVITPRTEDVGERLAFRDAGLAGDDMVPVLLRGIAAHLAPGGLAQLLVNWEIGPECPDWRRRWEVWADGLPLDLWLIRREAVDVATYADTWVVDAGHPRGSKGYERLVDAWLADFAGRGVTHVHFGILTLGVPQADPDSPVRAPWREFTDRLDQVAPVMGPAITAGMAARSMLADLSDEQLLEGAWRCAGDVTIEQHFRPGQGDPQVILARQGGGLGRAVRLGTVGAALIGVCDGEMTAAQALTAIVALTAADEAGARREVVTVLRELVADGLLVR